MNSEGGYLCRKRDSTSAGAAASRGNGTVQRQCRRVPNPGWNRSVYVRLLGGGPCGGTIKLYRRGLNSLYDDLPEDKTIRHGTPEYWQEKLVKKGYAPSTINNCLGVSNAYLDFMEYREYLPADQLKLEQE